MAASVRQDAKAMLIWGLIAFLAVNAFSWNPGWGGRHDKQPGRELERYFGWPACFYCDLWRSEHDHGINLALYFPPIPVSREMTFVYHSLSLVALLMNVVFFASWTFLCVILLLAEKQVRRAWMAPTGIGLIILGLLIAFYGHEFSTFL